MILARTHTHTDIVPVLDMNSVFDKTKLMFFSVYVVIMCTFMFT